MKIRVKSTGKVYNDVLEITIQTDSTYDGPGWPPYVKCYTDGKTFIYREKDVEVISE